MTARESAFQALHNLSGAKWLPLEALVRRLRKFGFSEQWTRDTAQEWYREFGLGARRVSDSPLPRREDAPLPTFAWVDATPEEAKAMREAWPHECLGMGVCEICGRVV